MKLLALLPLLLLTACANKLEESSKLIGRFYQPHSKYPMVAASPESLIGTWDSGCNMDGKSVGIYFQERIRFDGKLMISKSTSFADPLCKTSLVELEQINYFEVTHDEDGDYLKQKYFENRVTPKLDAQVDEFNSAKPNGYCGRTDWAKNQLFLFDLAETCKVPNQQLIPIEQYGDQEFFLSLCFDEAKKVCSSVKYKKL